MAERETGMLTEIPSYLKQLARITARGFFQVEDALIVDVLVRHPCMKEKQIEELLKFDTKLLRSRLNTLRNEKFVQTRLRMETGPDGKAVKVNYYFINYKSLVNVIKYKLDHMRKKMETQERDATNRASFKCNNCLKTYTDLEVGELFDPLTGILYCTFCRQNVEEDASAEPMKDTRLMLARFNEQTDLMSELLRKAENIKLAPELLDPEPPKMIDNDDGSGGGNSLSRGNWSGEATRLKGNESTRIDITIGEEGANKPKEEKKERPIWMQESTIGGASQSSKVAAPKAEASTSEKSAPREDIMSVLMTYEKGAGGGSSQKAVSSLNNESDSDMDDPDEIRVPETSSYDPPKDSSDVELMEDDDDDDGVPLVIVGPEKIPITQVDETVIARMTAHEKETYVQQYQDYHNYD